MKYEDAQPGNYDDEGGSMTETMTQIIVAALLVAGILMLALAFAM